VRYIHISYFRNQPFNAQFYKLCLLTISHQVTLKNIWKLCFGAKPFLAYAVGMCLHPSGMPEDGGLLRINGVRRNALG
jgi:hypothetical protein